MIISSQINKLEDIVRDMKSFTSNQLKTVSSENPLESRKECLPAEASAQAGGLLTQVNEILLVF